jgi:Arc/MetJ-type ribon-helix-helix transcriptional regulator
MQAVMLGVLGGAIVRGVSTPVQTRLSDAELAALDAAIARGRFASRSEALRAGLERVLRDEREREIAAAYERGYGNAPQEAWVGELGLALLGQAVAAERKDEDPL